MHDDPFFRGLYDKIWRELETQVRMTRNGGNGTKITNVPAGDPK